MKSLSFRKDLIGVQEELLRFAYKLTANREEANDLLQETSLKALDNEEKYVPDTNFKGWMYTIMRNIFINNYRKIVRDQTFVDQTDNLYHLNLPQDSGFESTEGAYDLKEMHRIVNALPKEYKVPFIINDNVDIAVAMNADGVHVGQSDMEAGDVRAKLGPDKIIGVSAQTVEQAKLAEAHGADYLGVGAVFATGSKDDAVEVGPRTLRDICQVVSIPVIAIGGISKENVSQLTGSGICGIAVISAIFAQKDVKAASKELHDLTAEMVTAPAEALQE